MPVWRSEDSLKWCSHLASCLRQGLLQFPTAEIADMHGCSSLMQPTLDLLSHAPNPKPRGLWSSPSQQLKSPIQLTITYGRFNPLIYIHQSREVFFNNIMDTYELIPADYFHILCGCGHLWKQGRVIRTSGYW